MIAVDFGSSIPLPGGKGMMRKSLRPRFSSEKIGVFCFFGSKIWDTFIESELPNMRILLLPFSFLFLLTISTPAFCQSNYSRYDTFRSLSFSYPELAGIIKDAEKFLQSVNGEPKNPRDVKKKIQIKKNGMQITFQTPDEMNTYEKKPEAAYEFSYFYYNENGKISQVNLDFGDYMRKISIEGTDANQIDALFSLLKEKFEGRQSIFGGSIFRMVSFLGIFLFLFLYVTWTIDKGIKMILKGLVWAIATLIGLGILYFKFDLFQGTAIYSGDASFIVRRSADIGLWGFLIGIFSVLLTYYFSKKKANPSPPAALTEAPPAPQIAPTPSEALVKKEAKTETQTVEDTKSVEGEGDNLHKKHPPK